MSQSNLTSFSLILVLLCGLTGQLLAQEKEESDTVAVEYSHEDLPLNAERSVHLQTNEGTWLSLDVHPDGEKVIFDFMGDLYELSIEGGEAERLTRGIDFDSQPRYSPGGDKVVFISDRNGGENVWILDLETIETERRTSGKNYRMQSPEWTPDGNYIIAARAGL